MNNSLKRSWKGLVKKGLLFCIIGVMAMSMVACGGKDKKSKSKEPKVQTEQSTNKKTNQKPSSQIQEKNDADDVNTKNKTDIDQNKTDDVKVQDGAEQKSDRKNSTNSNSIKKNSTKKNSTVQKPNNSGSITKEKKNN